MDEKKNIGTVICTAQKENSSGQSTGDGKGLKRAAAHCRVSTNRDMQDGSFEMQCAHYKKRIEDDPTLTLAGIYGDHGKSGRFVKGRKELNRLLKDCEDGKVDIIYTKSISRFARNLVECIDLIRKLKGLGVTIVFEKEGLDTGNQANELLLGILATIAQEESVSISQNMKWARRKRYEMGQPMERASYGFRSFGKEHRWDIHEPEAKRVRLAFYMAGMCHNYKEIRTALNRLEEAEGTGKVWNGTPLRNLLTNLACIGDYLSNKECIYADEDGVIHRGKNRGYADQFYIEAHHPAIVSRDLFEHVGQLIERTILYSFRSNFTEDEVAFMQECMEVTHREFADAPDLPWLKEWSGEAAGNVSVEAAGDRAKDADMAASKVAG